MHPDQLVSETSCFGSILFMIKVGVFQEKARISPRFWRKLTSLMSIWAV